MVILDDKGHQIDDKIHKSDRVLKMYGERLDRLQEQINDIKNSLGEDLESDLQWDNTKFAYLSNSTLHHYCVLPRHISNSFDYNY